MCNIINTFIIIADIDKLVGLLISVLIQSALKILIHMQIKTAL